jgi:hypothetical protein
MRRRASVHFPLIALQRHLLQGGHKSSLIPWRGRLGDLQRRERHPNLLCGEAIGGMGLVRRTQDALATLNLSAGGSSTTLAASLVVDPALAALLRAQGLKHTHGSAGEGPQLYYSCWLPPPTPPSPLHRSS